MSRQLTPALCTHMGEGREARSGSQGEDCCQLARQGRGCAGRHVVRRLERGAIGFRLMQGLPAAWCWALSDSARGGGVGLCVWRVPNRALIVVDCRTKSQRVLSRGLRSYWDRLIDLIPAGYAAPLGVLGKGPFKLTPALQRTSCAGDTMHIACPTSRRMALGIGTTDDCGRRTRPDMIWRIWIRSEKNKTMKES